tara:strand:+ start:156 stop:467 length:312 start_codon:yes stop_codon:yes gene_type:complete
MAEWLLTIWFIIIPTDTMEPKEFSFTTSYDSYEECVIEEDKFNSIVVNLPGIEFSAEAVCEPNPEYCTDDGCPKFMEPAIIFRKQDHGGTNCASCHAQTVELK